MIWQKDEQKPYFIRLGKEIPSHIIIDAIVLEYVKQYPDRIEKLNLQPIIDQIHLERQENQALQENQEKQESN